MTETALYENIARHLNTHCPAVRYHFDLSGVNNPSKISRSLYSRLNGRSWPDLHVAVAAFAPGTTNVYYGLFLEVKKEGERLRKRNGQWVNEHVREQAATLEKLQQEGYVGQFGVGLEECIQIIDSYMAGVPEMPQWPAEPVDDGKAF